VSQFSLYLNPSVFSDSQKYSYLNSLFSYFSVLCKPQVKVNFLTFYPLSLMQSVVMEESTVW